MSEDTWEASSGWWRSLTAAQRGVFIQAVYETQGYPPLRESSGPIADGPQWKRGYRVWGYWRDGERIGYVYLSPRRCKPVIYTWGIGTMDMGTCSLLCEAKRNVEAFFAESETA